MGHHPLTQRKKKMDNTNTSELRDIFVVPTRPHPYLIQEVSLLNFGSFEYTTEVVDYNESMILKKPHML